MECTKLPQQMFSGAPARKAGDLAHSLVVGRAIAAARNLPAAPRETVPWPGNIAATIRAFKFCAVQWSEIPDGAADLMKNVAEIGAVRRLFAARQRSD